VWLDQDHRRHAAVELCIRDLNGRRRPAALPSGKFSATAAWLVIATLAHHPARRCRLHLPAGWPWAARVALALARLRCVACAT
jgi:hypothetical protein